MQFSYFEHLLAKLLFLGVLLLFLLNMPQPVAAGEPATLGGNQTSYTLQTLTDDLFGEQGWFGEKRMGAFLAAVAGAAATVFAAQFLKRRDQYLRPYKSWLIQLYGALNEFSELCGCVKGDRKLTDEQKQDDICRQVDIPNYVIPHVWHMHKQAEAGYQWLGMIEKEDEEVYRAINRLFDAIDIFWHKLEGEHRVFGKAGYLRRPVNDSQKIELKTPNTQGFCFYEPVEPDLERCIGRVGKRGVQLP